VSFCSKCGNQIDPGDTFCSKCAAPTGATLPASGSAPHPRTSPAAVSSAKKNPIVLTAVAVVVVAAMAVGGFLLLQHNKTQQQSKLEHQQVQAVGDWYQAMIGSDVDVLLGMVPSDVLASVDLPTVRASIKERSTPGEYGEVTKTTWTGNTLTIYVKNPGGNVGRAAISAAPEKGIGFVSIKADKILEASGGNFARVEQENGEWKFVDLYLNMTPSKYWQNVLH